MRGCSDTEIETKYGLKVSKNTDTGKRSPLQTLDRFVTFALCPLKLESWFTRNCGHVKRVSILEC